MNKTGNRNAIVKMFVVGDLILGDHPHYLGFGVGSLLQKKNVHLFEFVEPLFAKADIVFGNLETVLSDLGKTLGYESSILRGKPQFVKQLLRGHFSIVNVANNHIQQHGEAAALETIDILTHNNIKAIGMDSLRPQRLFRQGLAFEFLGYSLSKENYASRPIYSQGAREKILADILRTRKNADFLIVSLHWGSEYIGMPAKWQVDLAHELIDSGADLIIGHHPHVLQPIEPYHGKFIVYSLGNFVSDMCQRKNRESAIVEFNFTRDKQIACSVVPVFINNQYQPELLAGSKAQLVIDLMSQPINPLNDAEYSRQVEECAKANRLRYALFLLSHFYRFSFKILFNNIYLAIKRRLDRN